MSTRKGQAGRGLSAAMCAILILTIFNQASMTGSALITESFESGFGDWVGDYTNDDGAYFDVSISSLYSYDGLLSVKLQSHGLPSDEMSVWIERTVQGPPNTWLTVGVTFQLYSEAPLGSPKEVLAYIGNVNPEDYFDFSVIGMTDQVADWFEYTHSVSFMSDSTGQVYVAVGYYNHIVGLLSYYVDLVNITGISDDFDPPTISNLQPLNGSTVSDNTPVISASYDDPSGIDVSSVILRVDGIDRTGMATITPTDVSFTPQVILFEGFHNVYLEVEDDTPNNNKATASWSFTVDSVAPTISNLQPVKESSIGDSTPMIGASYTDFSGIDTGSVVLKLDSVDITAQATVTSSDVSYMPVTPLADGVHDISLEVRDLSSPQNTALEMWWFLVDTQPPTIANLQPANQSYTGDPTPSISASYSDISGIDTSSVRLWVDANDVTPSASVTGGDVTYVPSISLPEGPHTVFLEAGDNSAPKNTAFKTWSFIVDTQAPMITNLQPAHLSIISDSTPSIGADYSDSSGIDVASVFYQVDGIDVSSTATITPSGVTYTPGFQLWDGIHNAYLEVKDNSDPQNLATRAWSFRVDATLPTIYNTQPANQSIIGDSTPDISGMYTDSFGIDEGTVSLRVDGVDRTGQSTVGPNMVIYTPSVALSEGTHDISLEVRDQAMPANVAVEMWSFMVDTQPPLVSNLQPMNGSTIGVATPTVGASYSDTSGIDTAGVVLKMDGIGITYLATVAASGIVYVPSTPLSDGVHYVHLTVSDNSDPQNVAIVTWWFTVAVQPPVITGLQPVDQSVTGDTTPTIGASYSDDTGIDVSSVMLSVDAIDVTAQATVTQTGVLYVPSSPLSDGSHSVFLSVSDLDARTTTESWSFFVDATPPTTSLTVIGANYTDGSNKLHVSSSTSFRLTAKDPAGIEAIQCLIHAEGEPEPAYSLYGSEFSIPTSKPDGVVYIKYKSMDDYGNEELPNTLEALLDNTPPASSISIGTPSYIEAGTTYLISDTPISFSSSDVTSSVDQTLYRVLKGMTVEINWTAYVSGIISLSGDDGLRQIQVKSTDLLGIEETEVVKAVYLDNSPPTSTMHVGSPSHVDGTTTYITSTTPISFSAGDGTGIGVDSTSYAIFKGETAEVDWTPFLADISILGDDGSRKVWYKSTDRLGNEEVEVVGLVFLDKTPPASTVTGYSPLNVTYLSDTLATVPITAMDSASGVNSIAYGVDDPNCPNTYSGALLVGTMGEGQHKIYFRSTDNVGNEETIRSVTVFLDTTPPNADAGDDLVIEGAEPTVFDGSGSDDGLSGSGIVSYEWTFTYRGSAVTLSGNSPHFTFEDRDAYVVTLTVTDRSGNSGMDTTTVTFAPRESAGEFPWWMVILALIVIISLLLILLLMRRKKDEEDERK